MNETKKKKKKKDGLFQGRPTEIRGGGKEKNHSQDPYFFEVSPFPSHIIISFSVFLQSSYKDLNLLQPSADIVGLHLWLY